MQHANEQILQQANTEFLKALRYLDYGKVKQGYVSNKPPIWQIC